MATFSADFAELLEPRLRRVYFDEYMMEPTLYTQVFNVIKSNRSFEDTLKVGGLGSLAQKNEGGPIAYDDPVQGTRKRVVHTVYALGFRVTMEMVADDLYNVINGMPKDLADSTKDHQERLAWGLFNDAFTGSLYTGLDGQALCTSHTTLKSGDTYVNELQPGVALSVSGLESLITRARLLINESGRYTPVTLSTLLIHPNNDHEAYRLLETEKEPGTGENQVNSVRRSRSGLVPLSVPYLSSTSSYFVLAKKNQHSVIWYNRMSPTFSNSKDSATKDALYDVMYRASVTFDDFRGVWGSTL